MGTDGRCLRPSSMAYMLTEQYFLQNVNMLFCLCTYNGSQMQGWAFPWRLIKSWVRYNTWYLTKPFYFLYPSSSLFKFWPHILILSHHRNMKALWFRLVLSSHGAGAWSSWFTGESLSAALLTRLPPSPPHSVASTSYIRRVRHLVCFLVIFSLS